MSLSPFDRVASVLWQSGLALGSSQQEQVIFPNPVPVEQGVAPGPSQHGQVMFPVSEELPYSKSSPSCANKPDTR